MSPEPSKAARYIELLDQARCDSDWDAVPELVRKVRKHAPQRTCLALVAETEYAVIQASQDRRSASASPNTPGLAPLIAPLSEAINKERTYIEDEFQAQVCLGWIYWVSGEPELTCSHLPKSIEQDFAQLDGSGKESAQWTKVCALKASYIKGTSLIRTGAPAEALKTFESALPILSSISSKSLDGSSEQRTWTELLLTQFSLLSSRSMKTKSSSVLESETLSAFRAWGNFWERQRGQASSPSGGYAVNSDVSRRMVWREYYMALSRILQQSLPYPTTSIATAYADASTRLLQRAELQRIESKYEELLLQEVQFPRAEQASEEVEEWAELVVQNWKILCGNSWQEHDPNQYGRQAVSRRVLEILYRAATKTFHSTSVLRHLFTVHLAVGDFDLAFKAFDTYLEIVKKGKSRVEKTGEVENGLDDDETVLKTASQCISALCRYGSRDAVEKARDLGQYFEEWLGKYDPRNKSSDGLNGNGDGLAPHIGSARHAASTMSSAVIAAAWRSIGIAKAQWARLTYEAASRSEIQLQAIESLRKALSPELNCVDNVETLFALAMVLAERRELGAAIDAVKRALLPLKASSNGVPAALAGRFERERSLIPMWHLLALLLSARQEFSTAVRACEGAFEQFKEPKNLFGDTELNGTYRSEHLNLRAVNEKSSSNHRGLVDDMDDFEKETVLEVKMTQLALIEVLEGPQIAVNASDELLSLYTRLFGEPQKSQTSTAKMPQPGPPQSSTGTLRSIKGSIFGRSRRSVQQSSRGRSSSLTEKSTVPARPHTAQTTASTVRGAPAIHVTNENGGTTNQPSHHEKLQKRSASLSRKKSQGSIRNRNNLVGRSHSENRIGSGTTGDEADRERLQTEPTAQRVPQRPEQRFKAARPGQDGPTVSSGNSSVALATTQESPLESAPRPLPLMSQNMSKKEESSKPDPNSQQETRFPQMASKALASNPAIRFPKDQERRRRIGILIRVWLLISGFYRRAEIYEDSKGAIDEAYKLVEALELDVCKDTSGNISIYDGGWGNRKSVEELWGDVWSERGYLSAAQGLPYVALSGFEAALIHFPDHPSAIVGLSNILLDIYTESLLPPSTLPFTGPTSPIHTPSQSTLSMSTSSKVSGASDAATPSASSAASVPQPGPLGVAAPESTAPQSKASATPKTSATAPLDRLAARDRAYGLLSGITKLGTGWNYSEAWFALARAHEEAGETEKARNALWWCVELEEGRPARNWECVGAGGYVL